jgi:hypothetical protein
VDIPGVVQKRKLRARRARAQTRSFFSTRSVVVRFVFFSCNTYINLGRDRIRLSLEVGSPGHVPSASRLATALSAQSGPHAPLSMAWRQRFILYRAARGPSSMIMVALCEKYRLVPHVRSHFGSGAPAEGYCVKG